LSAYPSSNVIATVLTGSVWPARTSFTISGSGRHRVVRRQVTHLRVEGRRRHADAGESVSVAGLAADGVIAEDGNAAAGRETTQQRVAAGGSNPVLASGAPNARSALNPPGGRVSAISRYAVVSPNGGRTNRRQSTDWPPRRPRTNRSRQAACTRQK
jgi:hypothetical protein